MGGKVFSGFVSLSLFLVTGCVSAVLETSPDSTTHELAFGYVQVETKGPHPRIFPCQNPIFSPDE